MVRVSNWVIAGLNLVTFAMGCVSIFLAFYLHQNSEHSACAMWLKIPLLVIGGVLMVLSIMGIAGACCRVSFFMWIYLAVLFLIMMCMVTFTIFMLFASNKGIFTVFDHNPDSHHRPDYYSSWLQKEITRSSNCTQRACCQPPQNCGFKFQNATYWVVPEAGPAAPGPDCKIWNNDPRQLCFGCESCKVTILEQVQKEWKLLAITNACFLGVVLIVYCIGCCALRNNRSYGYSKYQGAYYG